MSLQLIFLIVNLMLKFAIKTKTKDSIVSVITWVKTRTNRSVSQKLFDISWQHPLRSTRQIFLALVLLGPTLIMFWVFIEHFDFHIGQEKKKKKKKNVTSYMVHNMLWKILSRFFIFFFFSSARHREWCTFSTAIHSGLQSP